MTADTHDTAMRLAEARSSGEALARYPGAVPSSLDDAYAIQDAMIGMRDDEVAGWKIGAIAPAYRETLGQDRFSGPVFARTVLHAGRTNPIRLPTDGFAAIEAELVVRLGRDLPDGASTPTAAELTAAIGSIHAGVELLSGGLRDPVSAGSGAVTSDCGLNSGVVVGGTIAAGEVGDDGARVEVTISGGNGTSVHTGVANTDFARGMAFLAGNLARRGHRLRRGDWICTGALTGLHPVRPGDRAIISFGGLDPIELEFLV